MEPEYKLQIKKSESTTSFQLKLTEDVSDDDGHKIMAKLIREEDERGEKPPTKKLKEQMRHITRSSKNIFNIKQKLIDNGDSEKSIESSIAKSLIVLFPNSLFIKEESSSTSSGGGAAPTSVVGRTTINEIRKQNFKAKCNNKPEYQQRQRPIMHKPFKKAIARSQSVNDNSAIKHNTSVCHEIPATVSTYRAFKDNTRSSPNIPAEDDTDLPITVAAVNAGSSTLSLCETDGDYSCSSLISSTSSESSITSVEKENAKPSNLKPKLCKNISVQTDETEDEKDKIEQFIQMCQIQQQDKDDAYEQLQYKYMKPTPSHEYSFEDSLEDVKKSPSLLKELKVFSQHMQV